VSAIRETATAVGFVDVSIANYLQLPRSHEAASMMRCAVSCACESIATWLEATDPLRISFRATCGRAEILSPLRLSSMS
jgi:hypothetical protein